MNYTPEQARELVACALESGKYKQEQKMLHNYKTDKYCCLGLATHLFMLHESHNIKITQDSNSQKTYYNEEYHRKSTTLLFSVQNWLGFTYPNGAYGPWLPNYTRTGLAADNDKGMSFVEIAEKFRNPPAGLLLKE